jgi:hypothetical protein
MARNTALPILTAEPGLTHYLEEIRRFPMVGAPGRIHASQTLARARRSRRGAQARHQPSAARDQDRQGLSRLKAGAFKALYRIYNYPINHRAIGQNAVVLIAP